MLNVVDKTVLRVFYIELILRFIVFYIYILLLYISREIIEKQIYYIVTMICLCLFLKIT